MTTPPAARPPILLSADEADSRDLAMSVRDRHANVSTMLLEEIDRAETLPAGEMPGDVVRMGSTVGFVVEATGERRTVKLVYPAEADIEQDRVSILTPVGAGLIGLRVGQTISWPTRTGEERLLRIESVAPD